MAKPTHQEVSKQLETYNGRQLDDSSMADTARKIRSAPDGYCEGVALDWIRRVVQGGRVSFKPDANTNGSSSDRRYLLKVQTQAARQAGAFSQWEPIKQHWGAKFDERKTRKEQEWNQHYTAQGGRLHKLHLGLIALLNSDPSPQLTLTPQLLDWIREFFTDPVSNLMNRNKIEAILGAIPQLKADFKPPAFDPQRKIVRGIHQELQMEAWTDFSRKADANNTRKRKFSKLSVLVISPTVEDISPSGLAVKLNLIGTNALQDQAAVKLNLGGWQNGRLFYHSTAALQKGRLYFFLDPNYGVFAYTQWLDVIKALLHLYTKVYNWTGTPAVRDTPFPSYKMQFDVFGPPKP